MKHILHELSTRLIFTYASMPTTLTIGLAETKVSNNKIGSDDLDAIDEMCSDGSIELYEVRDGLEYFVKCKK